MKVDVAWDGRELVKGAQATERDGGWFVELEQPMPVGTALVLSGDVQANVTVARVHEGLGGGMLVKGIERRPEATSDNEKPDPAPENGGGGKKRKKKKTLS